MRKQSGNVLFLILIAVVLFAALSYAVTQSSRGGGNADSEATKIAVSEAINYVSAVRTAITRMKIAGVDNDNFCFDHTSWGHTDYNHAACADNTTQVFHADGGGVAWSNPPQGINDGTPWLFNGNNRIPNVGTTALELTMILPNVTEEACREFSEAVGEGGSVKYDPDFFNVTNRFAGSYGPTTVATDGSSYDFCVQASTTGGGAIAGSYHFFATLIAR